MSAGNHSVEFHGVGQSIIHCCFLKLGGFFRRRIAIVVIALVKIQKDKNKHRTRKMEEKHEQEQEQRTEKREREEKKKKGFRYSSVLLRSYSFFRPPPRDGSICQLRTYMTV